MGGGGASRITGYEEVDKMLVSMDLPFPYQLHGTDHSVANQQLNHLAFHSPDLW